MNSHSSGVPKWFSKARIALLAAALFPSAFVAVSSLDMPQLGRFHDDGLYWVCAKSLAEGSGYRIPSLQGEPYQTKYPPLFPLLLAAVWKIDPAFPHNLRWATAVCWLALPLCMVLVARLFKNFGPERTAVVCVMLALNPNVRYYCTTPMSELWFLCALLGCFLLTHRAGKTGSGLFAAAAAGVLGGVAYLTRAVALPLLICCPAYFLILKQYRRALVFALGMLPAVVAWTLWASRHTTPSHDLVSLYYTNYFALHLASFSWSDLPVLAWKNAVWMVAGAGDLLALFRGNGLLASILGFAAVFGAVRSIRRTGIGAYHLYAVGLTAMLLVWHLYPTDSFGRLLFPLFPIIAAGLYDLLRDGVCKLREWHAAGGTLRTLGACALALGIAALVLLTVGGSVAAYIQAPAFLAKQRQDLAADRAAYRWLEANTPPEAAILSSGVDPLVYLYTGRKACRLVISPRVQYFPRPPGARQPLDRALAAFARTHGLDYVVLQSGEHEATIPKCGHLELLYAAEARIFRVPKQQSASGPDHPERPCTE